MIGKGDVITKQCTMLINSKKHAILYAIIFSILPFTSWLSVALFSFVTLRRGPRQGFDVMLPAFLAHTVPLMMLIPLSSTLINTLIAYLPCYFATLVLRRTEKWQMVFGVYLAQVFLGCLLIQLLTPEFIVEQFDQVKSLLMHYQELVDAGIGSITSVDLAQFFFGIQMLSAIISSIISLMFARSIQSKLFVPGGFQQELSTFRSGRLSLIILIGACLGTYYEMPLAINIIPIILAYFLVSGFALAYFILSRKRQFMVFVLLVLLIVLKPTFALFAYIVIGSLDSLFNLRSYLPERVRESI